MGVEYDAGRDNPYLISSMMAAAKRRLRQSRQNRRSGLQLSSPKPRSARAVECDRALHAGKMRGWTGTQNGEAAFDAVVSASGVPPEKCEVHKIMLGGGFGRRGFVDYVEQAVLIAKQVPGTPVKLLWLREEDMAHGKYHPVTQGKLSAAFDADKNQSYRNACANLGSIHLHRRATGNREERPRSRGVPRPRSERRRAHRL